MKDKYRVIQDGDVYKIQYKKWFFYRTLKKRNYCHDLMVGNYYFGTKPYYDVDIIFPNINEAKKYIDIILTHEIKQINY